MESLHSICPLFPKPVLTEYAPSIHFAILKLYCKKLACNLQNFHEVAAAKNLASSTI